MAASNNKSGPNPETIYMDLSDCVVTADNHNGEMDYKMLIALMKAYSKDANVMIDQAAELSVKFANHVATLASILDPEANAILYQKLQGIPDFTIEQARALAATMTSEEIDQKYAEMCDKLDQRAAERRAQEEAEQQQRQEAEQQQRQEEGKK